MRTRCRQIFAAAVLAWLGVFHASEGLGLTGALGQGDNSGFALTGGGASPGRVVRALQLSSQGEGGEGFSLTGQELLGRYGLNAHDVITALAPHLTDVTPILVDAESQGDTVHEVYEMSYGGVRLANAHVILHHHQNRLVHVSGELPEIRLPSTPFGDDDFITLEALGLSELAGEKIERVVASAGGLAAAAYQVTRALEDGSIEELLIEAQTGATLGIKHLAFDLARVYEKSPRDERLIEVQLEGLPQTGYLDGKHFSVYAPREADPRVQAPDLVFDYRPDDPADQLSFDQVEAYYAATKALAFFRNRVGFDIENERLPVRINDDFDGRVDNAQYVPPPLGPEIRVGRGGDALQNLARDTDVVIHEFAHHVIYRWLKNAHGESGILHEGTADYFAYAINGDPYLGESIVQGAPYLRTAALDESLRFDQVPQRTGSHNRGQYWSAVLWDLRLALGEETDKLVYRALSYFGRDALIADAFLALFNADRDLNPRDDSERGIFGKNKCQILSVGIRRGFAQHLEAFDGASCGLNLKELAAESRDRSFGIERTGQGGKHFGMSLFGKRCATVEEPVSETSIKLLLLLLALPPLLSFSVALFGRSVKGPPDGP